MRPNKEKGKGGGCEGMPGLNLDVRCPLSHG